MNIMTILESVFMWAAIVSAMICWASLVGDIVEHNSRLARARARRKQRQPLSPTYGSEGTTYGDESPAEVKRMYGEAGLID